MAGNKMSTKTKGKEDRNKTNSKPIDQTNEDAEEPDFALLRKPIPTSITGLGQVRKIYDLVTEELKDLLSNECDLIYECKVCRNIFRSVANFISHKRVYCKEKFNMSVHSHFVKTTSMNTELMKIKRLEQGYQESLIENIGTENETCDPDERIPMTKDLTTIIEKIAKNKAAYTTSGEHPQVTLQKMTNSSVAVFQNVKLNTEKQIDEMKVQVKELDNILSKDIAVLQSDGNFKIKSSVAPETDHVIQISDDEDNDNTNSILICKICDMKFSTQKTLKFHMKYKHVESRLVYPCPDCLEIFSTSWSVYRHLFKVHRKTAAQIRRLRESIQAKAFKMNNPPAFYEKRKNNMKATAAQKMTDEERLDQENQAWMVNLEGDGELPRCGGCGRTFERRAALAAHTHTCQPRSRALARRHHETKRIEIQIRKDYNKGPSNSLNLPLKTTESSENKISKDDAPIVNKTNKDKAVEEEENVEEEEKVEEEKAPAEQEQEKDIEDDPPMDMSEDEKSTEAESPEKEMKQLDLPKINIRLPFAHQAEKNNIVIFRQKIQADVEGTKLLCKRCDIQFNDIQELYDHMAEHLKWMRYACKLCNFKSYSFEKVPEHVKIVHKLKGDKDFYFSTVKAIDGSEALDMCESLEDPPDANETSPESRRPSRCSSDSSRLSDDSSSSSTRVEGSRKRKIYQNKTLAKRRKVQVNKGSEDKDGDSSLDKNINLAESLTSSSMKSFEENSSDMDDIIENVSKKSRIVKSDTSVASRRPVRRRTKPKNEDFEYDLSNLLKMEAQGYRDALVMQANAKSNQSKKKVQQEIQINYENVNKECVGALMAMSKKYGEKSAAHIRTSTSSYFSAKEVRPPNIFLRPMLPKTTSKGDKTPPKKDNTDEQKDNCSPVKEPVINKVLINIPTKISEKPVSNDLAKTDMLTKASDKSITNDLAQNVTSVNKDKSVTNDGMSKNNDSLDNNEPLKDTEVRAETSEEHSNKEQTPSKTIELKKPISIPPIKFRRQSLDVIKNPLINKNITDLAKAGMKTKILVIKPINRNKDGTQTVKTPLKFQTIKLKDPNKNSSNEDKLSDQVVVVKVPKVDCTIARPIVPDTYNSSDKTPTNGPGESDSTKNVVDSIDKATASINNNETKTIENVKCNEESVPNDESKVEDIKKENITISDTDTSISESESVNT